MNLIGYRGQKVQKGVPTDRLGLVQRGLYHRN